MDDICNTFIKSEIEKNITSYLLFLQDTKHNLVDIKQLIKCIKKLLDTGTRKYNINMENKNDYSMIDIENFQLKMSKLNEKEKIRKKNGVYYTPKDVVDFMIYNCFNKLIKSDDNVINNLPLMSKSEIDCILNSSVFDPTCGSGEFLIGVINAKLQLINNNAIDLEQDIVNISKNIYGNDINRESIDITKIRIFFELINKITNVDLYYDIASILNKNFYDKDFININVKSWKKFDLIIGNPPYVEDSKSTTKPVDKFGNIYANVMLNSTKLLKENGVVSFIIPISYTSTLRMKKVRSEMVKEVDYQYIFNFADRPDCLFQSVHQKLSIILAEKNKIDKKIFTTNYNYWYKSERTNLFNNLQIVESKDYNEFYPKIGNEIESKIFSKVYTNESNSIVDINNKSHNYNVFLNMRACFWIKCFSFNPGSKEYKGFAMDNDSKYIVLSILNSSLFFLYWNIVSDCWHITGKELKHFKVILDTKHSDEFKKLYSTLEKKLEKTKRFIGTKQTQYEYKHKLCKSEIDKIDDKLAEIYNLTQEELNYIKEFASKYRESLGGQNESN